VPPFVPDMQHPTAIPGSQAANARTMAKYNRQLRENDRCALKFTPNDIRYIVVKDEAEILVIEQKINTLKEKFSDRDRRLLKTRLISARQILEDF
jgi:hypothetical protein